MNDHEYDAITFPARSFTPDTVTAYDVDAANAADGVNVNTVPAPFNTVDPATADPPDGTTDTEAPDCTGSDNVTDTGDNTDTPDAPNPGTVDTTLGGVVSTAAVVNDHEYAAITFPARSFTPDTVTAYDVDAANAADGVNVNTVPAPFNTVDPATADPPDGTTDTEAPDCTGSDNVTDTADDTTPPTHPTPAPSTPHSAASYPPDVVKSTSTQ